MSEDVESEPRPFNPDWCIHPGAFVLEELVARFAEKSCLTEEVLRGVLSGQQEVTLEVAIGLGRGFNTSPQLWLGLETTFREGLAAGKTWVNK